MNKHTFIPLPQQVAARDDLSARAKFEAWRKLQPPDGITQAEAAGRFDLSVDTLSRISDGGNVETSTLRTLGRATGLWDWGFRDPEMAATAAALAAQEATS